MRGMPAPLLEKSRDEMAEKGKELTNNFKNLEIMKPKEFSEFQNKVIQEADTKTAMNLSLLSVLEENKEKREIQETKDRKEGLSEEQKEKLGELSGWSDEIFDVISSWEEAEIYVKAGLKEVEINGKKCLIRDDIDLSQADEDGITNREKMERGRPPITKDGENIELHHIGQKQNSSLAELTMEQHRGIGNDIILHDKTKETEIDRNEFGKERREHWKDRVNVMGGK